MRQFVARAHMCTKLHYKIQGDEVGQVSIIEIFDIELPFL